MLESSLFMEAADGDRTLMPLLTSSALFLAEGDISPVFTSSRLKPPPTRTSYCSTPPLEY